MAYDEELAARVRGGGDCPAPGSDTGGRPMKGWVLVDADRLADDDVIGAWVQRGAGVARSAPREVTRRCGR